MLSPNAGPQAGDILEFFYAYDSGEYQAFLTRSGKTAKAASMNGTALRFCAFDKFRLASGPQMQLDISKLLVTQTYGPFIATCKYLSGTVPTTLSDIVSCG